MKRDEREIRDEDLMNVAEDPERARQLHRALRTIRDNPSVGGQLRQMAGELLAGRMSMQDVARSDEYLHAVGDRLTRIRRDAQRVEDLPREEREARREQFEDWRKERREQAEAAERDQAEAAERDQAGEGRDTWRGTPATPQPRRHRRGQA